MWKREPEMAGLESAAPPQWPSGRGTANRRGREREPARRQRVGDGASTRNATDGLVRTRRRRYFSVRAVISLIALASLVVPGIVAVIAAAVSTF